MSKKRLSIILPTFNSMPYLKFAVESILCQTYSNFNLIIVNDGSTDYTLDYLNKLSDSRIMIINKNHTGIIDSCNIGLKIANTEFIARTDADDYYFANKFEKQINYLDQNPEITILGTNGVYLSENNKFSKIKINLPIKHEEIIDEIFFRKRGIIQSSIVFRSNILNEPRWYTDNILPEDYNFYLEYGLTGRIANISENLVAIRLHKSYSYKNIEYLINNLSNLLKKYHILYGKKFKSINLIKLDTLAIIINKKAIYFFINNKYCLALIYFCIGLTLNPKRSLNFIKNRII